MSFHASIESEKHKLIWSKSLLSLSLISHEIKFVITNHQLAISAINSTGTGEGEISFDKQFFESFSIELKRLIDQGFDPIINGYLFIINSNHLSILFKNFDVNSTINFHIKFNDDLKLLIDIQRNLIIKKYQINYQPVKNVADSVSDDYRNSCQFIKIDNNLLKDFLDMVPLQTEEFRVEIRNGKILFSGFTNLIMKNNQYLKQPMSITISVNLNDLPDLDIEDENQFINFKLKFFKIFINLINLVNKKVDYGENEEFKLYFKEPGDLAMFEFDTQLIKIKFFQLTNNEQGESTGEPITKSYTINPVPSRSNGQIEEEEIDQINFDLQPGDEMEFGATQTDEVKSIFD